MKFAPRMFPRTDFFFSTQKSNDLSLPKKAKKNGEPTTSFWREHAPKNTLTLKNRASLANKATVSVSSKILQLYLWSENNGLCQIVFKWTYIVNLFNWWGCLKNKLEFSGHSFTYLAVTTEMAGIDVPWTEISDFFLTSHAQFLFIFGQCVNNCQLNQFMERNVGVTECPGSLNSRKALAMAIFPIIVHFTA